MEDNNILFVKRDDLSIKNGSIHSEKNSNETIEEISEIKKNEPFSKKFLKWIEKVKVKRFFPNELNYCTFAAKIEKFLWAHVTSASPCNIHSFWRNCEYVL